MVVISTRYALPIHRKERELVEDLESLLILVTEEQDSITILLITILDKSEEASINKEDVLKLIKKCGL